MLSNGGEPKIYLRGITPHNLIHGGLGHQLLRCEELILLWCYLVFPCFILALMENALKRCFLMSLLLFLTKLECMVPSPVTICLIPGLPHLKNCSSCLCMSKTH